MIVYVETNFVLELAYLRRTSDNCQELLRLAADKKISLVIPAFALIEARLAWQRNVARRNRLHKDVRAELGELSRSRPLTDIESQSNALVAALIDTAAQDRDRLEEAIASLRDRSSVIAADAAIVTNALAAERIFDLSPQDAVIYATVIEHAQSNTGVKVFVTQNSNDFRVPKIEQALAKHGCKLLLSFDDAENYIRAQLAT